MQQYVQQESIPVGCVPTTEVAFTSPEGYPNPPPPRYSTPDTLPHLPPLNGYGTRDTLPQERTWYQGYLPPRPNLPCE